jgi:hydrogenase maturation protease
MSPSNEKPDTEQPVPPYEGRRETADVGTKEESTKDGAKTKVLPPAPHTNRAHREARTCHRTRRSDVGRGVLVAGVGNLFLGDDGFGPRVVQSLAVGGVPEHVRAVDYGIRGMHLAYDLLDEYDALVIVDCLPGDGGPGEVVVLQVGPEDLGHGDIDAHGMDPFAVLSSLERLGGTLPPTYVVGCRPLTVEEGIGLSKPVQDAVPAALTAVRTLLETQALATGRP